MARPTGFSQELADQVIDRISEGEMLTKICEDEDMPTARQFRYWLTVHDDLAASYARARLSWADTWAERVMDISFNPQGGAIDGKGNLILDHATIALLKLQTDNAKWLVGKWAPRQYGEKPEEPIAPAAQVTRIVREIIAPAEPTLEPPRQLTYAPRREPGDLTPEDWSVLGEVLDLIKRTVPINHDRPPAEIFGVIREALLGHFRAPNDVNG